MLIKNSIAIDEFSLIDISKVNTNINNEELFFYRMLCPASAEFSQYYLKEEEQLLKNFIANHARIKNMHFVVVGAGPLLHLNLGYRYSKCYVAVDLPS